MEIVGCKTAADIAAHLGIHRNSAQKMRAEIRAGREIEVKQTVALAMSAVAALLPAWGEKGESDE